MLLRREIVQALDMVLRPIGFIRRNLTWNKRASDWVQVVELQISKSGDLLFVRFGIQDSQVFSIVWPEISREFVSHAECTLKADGLDSEGGQQQWWDLKEIRSVEPIIQSILTRGLPLLNQLGRREEAVACLAEMLTRNSRDPTLAAYFAVSRYLEGHRASACEQLETLSTSAVGRWKEKSRDIAIRLGC